MEGRAAQINEYLIGSEVFKRGSNYNPSEDSIVRRHAHAMRQEKLQEYYATEGADHAIRIEMPVGRYVPLFRRKEDLVPEPPASPERRRAWRRQAAWAVAVIGSFALGWIASDLRSPGAPRLTLPTREIWGAWIGVMKPSCASAT